MNTPVEPSFKPQSEFLRTLHERGFIHQCTDMAALDARLCAGSVVGYTGFDLTADSLHVGHLIPIMMLRWFQKTGHKPVVLLGGGTTRIGDPSFRDTTRPILDDEQIAANLQGIRSIFERVLDFGDGPNGAEIVNNADWLDDLGYIEFMREVGRHFSVNRMLTFDSVRQRLEREQSLSLLEFNYMVLQAYDFLELARTRGCTLQFGASDQWGNIVNGVELGRRADNRDLFGLTAPLLTTSSGVKMGKTASGAIWLNPGRLASYEFWQFWRNTEDANVGRFLRLFTELPLDEIARLEKLRGAEVNEAKKVLADEVTMICRGREAALAARETARRTFEAGEAASGLPTFTMEAARLRDGFPIADLMVAAGLAASKGEARRLVRNGGARVNNAPVINEETRISVADVQKDIILLSAGRKRHVRIRVN